MAPQPTTSVPTPQPKSHSPPATSHCSCSSSRWPSRQFDAWLDDALRSNPEYRTKALRIWDRAPSARVSHAQEDHLIPLMVAVGAAEGETATRTYHQDDFAGFITASSYRFGETRPV